MKTIEQLERFVDDYIECYELDDDEEHHEPTEHERHLIADAINGLIADDDFLALVAEHQKARADGPDGFDNWISRIRPRHWGKEGK